MPYSNLTLCDFVLDHLQRVDGENRGRQGDAVTVLACRQNERRQQREEQQQEESESFDTTIEHQQ